MVARSIRWHGRWLAAESLANLLAVHLIRSTHRPVAQPVERTGLGSTRAFGPISALQTLRHAGLWSSLRQQEPALKASVGERVSRVRGGHLVQEAASHKLHVP